MPGEVVALVQRVARAWAAPPPGAAAGAEDNDAAALSTGPGPLGLRVLFEDDDLAAVVKPPGMPTAPARTEAGRNCLFNSLLGLLHPTPLPGRMARPRHVRRRRSRRSSAAACTPGRCASPSPGKSRGPERRGPHAHVSSPCPPHPGPPPPAVHPHARLPAPVPKHPQTPTPPHPTLPGTGAPPGCLDRRSGASGQDAWGAGGAVPSLWRTAGARHSPARPPALPGSHWRLAAACLDGSLPLSTSEPACLLV